MNVTLGEQTEAIRTNVSEQNRVERSALERAGRFEEVSANSARQSRSNAAGERRNWRLRAVCLRDTPAVDERAFVSWVMRKHGQASGRVVMMRWTADLADGTVTGMVNDPRWPAQKVGDLKAGFDRLSMTDVRVHRPASMNQGVCCARRRQRQIASPVSFGAAQRGGQTFRPERMSHLETTDVPWCTG